VTDSHPKSHMRTRVLVALAFALVTGAYATARALHEPNWPTDFDQLWHAARALVDGKDPYSVVGPGRSFVWDWPLYYPLPAVLLAVPFTLVPVLWARILFSALSAAALGWALGPRVRTHWPLLLSAAFIISTSRAQWAPLLLAATWVPAIGFVIAAKPNVGLATLAAQGRRGFLIAAAGCAVMLLASFIIQPGWVTSWRQAISTAPHIQSAVTMLPAGPLLALAALKWKRADARLLLALAIIPHTPSVYDLLVLFFACRTLRETMVLALLTQSLYWGIVLFGSFQTFDAYAAGLGRAAVFLVYLPVLVSILFRPNRDEGPAQASGADRSAIVPSNWLDAVLLSLLLVSATLLIWLPLVTYR
jgi:hypothetical protein